MSSVYQFNFEESIQPCSISAHWNLSYTVPSLFYQVLIFTWVRCNIWSTLPNDTILKQCPKMKWGETWYFSKNPKPSGVRNRTSGSDIGRAPRSSNCATSLPVFKWSIQMKRKKLTKTWMMISNWKNVHLHRLHKNISVL